MTEYFHKRIYNLLPDNKILALSKLKAFAYDKLNVNENIKFAFLK